MEIIIRIIDFIRKYIQYPKKNIIILVTIALVLQTLFGFFYIRSLKKALISDDSHGEFSGEISGYSGHRIVFTPAEISFFLKSINISSDELYDYHLPKIDSIKILIDEKEKELIHIKSQLERARKQNTGAAQISLIDHKKIFIEEQVNYYKENLSFWESRSKGLRNLVKTLGLDSITYYLAHKDSVEHVLAELSPPKIQIPERDKKEQDLRTNIQNENKFYTDRTSLKAGIDSKKAKLVPRAMLKTGVSSESPSSGISQNEIFAMIRNHDFFDYYWNNNGKGFKNSFSIQNISGTSVVVDEATRLMWQQSGSSNPMKYEGINIWIENLNESKFAGNQDWRLPTLKEAMSLLESEKKELYIDTIFSDEQKIIWTSDFIKGQSCIWVVSFSLGGCRSSYSLELGYYYIRAVRSMR